MCACPIHILTTLICPLSLSPLTFLISLTRSVLCSPLNPPQARNGLSMQMRGRPALVQVCLPGGAFAKCPWCPTSL
ncbi:hypothetical protein BDR07DRAFT_1397802 [Suillus spraguei]|nr:hypothetical protein BDR07DRAFT_1397802 [Suillus spraguei]